MQRVFLRDEGKCRAGDVKDFPLSTWKSFFPGYESYTRAPDEVVKEMIVERLGIEHSEPRPKPKTRSKDREAAHV